MILHPAQILRENVISLISQVLPRASTSKISLKEWEDENLCSRIGENLITLTKQFPSLATVPLYLILWKKCGSESAPRKTFLKKLVNIFNYEKVELPEQFERRQLVLKIIEELLNQGEGGRDDFAQVVLPVILRSQHITELQETLEAQQKHLETDLGPTKFATMLKSVNVRRSSLLAGQKRPVVAEERSFRKKRKH